MSYFRHWDCERCGEPQESIDLPDVEVCDRCVGADQIVASSYPAPFLRRIANAAYERGYMHGKAVAEKKNAARLAERS